MGSADPSGKFDKDWRRINLLAALRPGTRSVANSQYTPPKIVLELLWEYYSTNITEKDKSKVKDEVNRGND